MNLTGIQIVLLFIIILLIVRTIVRYRDKTITISAVLGWMVLWVLGGLVVIFPDSTGRLADTLGVGRGVDAIVYSSIVVLFFLLFKLYGRMNVLEKEITKLVSALAIQTEERRNEKES